MQQDSSPLNVVLVYGSVRSQRQGMGLALFLRNALRERGHHTHLIDPLEAALPLLDKMYKEYPPGEAPADMEGLAEQLRAADAFVMVSGEYNHGIPPALKNLLDHFLEEWFFRPSAIACYSAGPFGGVRAAMQLRMTLAELGMSSIPSLFAVPSVQSAFDAQGMPQDPAWPRRATRFLDELLWYAAALRAARQQGLPY